MLKIRRRFLGLCLLPILLTCLDNGLTLWRQPREYWAGDYTKAQEGNSWHYRLMAYHPLALVAEEAGSMLVFLGMILLLPQTLALTISIAATLGYMVDASTWLLYGGASLRSRDVLWLVFADSRRAGPRNSLGPASRAPRGCAYLHEPAVRTSLGVDCAAFWRRGLHQSLAT